MKINKLAYALCAVLTLGLASCSNENEWDEDANTSSATTVEFADAQLTIKENKGIAKIPVVCTGEQNGRVSITVKCEPIAASADNESAIEDTHYIVTSKTINIGSETQEAFVEINTVDDADINTNRMFKITITEVNGAKLGTNASCVVTLKDNDSAFYEKLQGKWKMTVYDYFDEVDVEWDVNIVGYDEGEEGYNKVLYIIGINGVNYAEAQLNYYYDMTTKTGYVEIPFGSFCAENLNFGGTYGVCSIYIYGVNGNQIVQSGGLKGNWNSEFNKITFPDTTTRLHGLLRKADGTQTGASWFGFSDVRLER